MAQEKVAGVPDFDLREAEEIERLLKEEEERAEAKKLQTHPLKRLLNPKLVLGITGAILLIWGASWGILSLIESRREASQVSLNKPTSFQQAIPSAIQIQKPNIYPLKPFFVPVFSKSKKKERFLHVTAHLVLSNRRLHTDIDKVQSLIRQTVYGALRRKRLKDFDNGGVKIEERIKREILTASNSFLLSGTGTITNIIFTEFIISPS